MSLSSFINIASHWTIRFVTSSLLYTSSIVAMRLSCTVMEIRRLKRWTHTRTHRRTLRRFYTLSNVMHCIGQTKTKLILVACIHCPILSVSSGRIVPHSPQRGCMNHPTIVHANCATLQHSVSSVFLAEFPRISVRCSSQAYINIPEIRSSAFVES